MSFESFELHPDLDANVKSKGFEIPTPIQTEAIPVVMAGKDVLGTAQTGTGKTAAFALPILHRLQDQARGCLRALVVAPTRELAEQIRDVFVDLGTGTGVRVAMIYGGVPIEPQIEELSAGAEVAIACPGRLIDHISRGTISFESLDVLVLDEADRMLDMGFLPAVQQIVQHVPAKRQTLLFSATMPDEIVHLAEGILTDPVQVRIGQSAPARTVAHTLYPVEQHLKTKLLLELLKTTETGSVLVFARTKRRARRVGDQLKKAGYQAASLQGDMSQHRRQNVMAKFRDGTYRVLAATDIAARGIDVATVSHVINYDMPDTVDAYTHRIGRTGRAESTGDAFTMITPDDESMVSSIERVLGVSVERRTIDGFDYAEPAPEHHDNGGGQNDRKDGGQGGGQGSRRDSNRSGGQRSSRGDASRGRRGKGRGKEPQSRRSPDDDSQPLTNESTRRLPTRNDLLTVSGGVYTPPDGLPPITLTAHGTGKTSPRKPGGGGRSGRPGERSSSGGQSGSGQSRNRRNRGRSR